VERLSRWNLRANGGSPAEIELILDRADGQVAVDGATVTLITEVRSCKELESILETYFYALPPLLALEMLESPIVTEVNGCIGAVSFCWGLARQRC
jgi:hypothetical protein